MPSSTHSLRSAALVLLAAALALALPTPAAGAPAGGSAAVCATADRLTGSGDPAGAIAAISDLREAAPAANGASPACVEEYARAVQRQADAAALAGWAARMDGGGLGTFVPKPVPPVCSGPPLATGVGPTSEATAALVRSAVQAALVCDGANATALSLQEELGTSAAQVADSAWTDFQEAWVDPALSLAAVVLVWLAVVLAAARLLLGVLGNRAAARLATAPSLRIPCLVAGPLALLLSCMWVVGLPSMVGLGFDASWSSEGTDLGLVAVLGAAALLLTLGWRRTEGSEAPDSQDSPDTSDTVTGAVVALVAAVGLVAVVGLLSPLTVSWREAGLDPDLGQATVLGLCAAILLALTWGSRARLTITSTGEGAPSSEHLRALVRRLAPPTPGGIEVPLGTDAEMLADVGIVETSSTPWIAALGRAVRLLRPPTPWRLSVTQSEDRTVVELVRNYRVIDTQTIDRAGALGFLRTEGASSDPTAALDLAVFPAATAVTRISLAHGITQGLAGATVARSVALHALAAQEPRGSTIQQALYAEAVEVDPDNQLAVVGYWHSLYREASTDEDLRAYLHLLGHALESDVVRREPALRLRLLHTRVSVGINRASLLRAERDASAGAAGASALKEETYQAHQVALARDAQRLLAALEDRSSGVDEEFRRRLERSALVLTRSVPACPAVGWRPPGGPLREPEEFGPGLNYAAGCHLAEIPGRAALAVRHLACADVDPMLAAWRDRDPQLAVLRSLQQAAGPDAPRTNPYRSRFGTPLPQDMLAVAPFREHAAALRTGGMATIDRLSRASLEQLEGLGLSSATSVWLREIAVLARSARSWESLRPWHLAVATELADLGEIGVPPLWQGRTELVARLEARLEGYVSSPATGTLDAWLSERETGRMVQQRGSLTTAFLQW